MVTKYQIIYEDLKALITTASVLPGQRMPDEHALCARYSCSRMTVRKAYDKLVEERLVFRKQGAGTFVTKEQDDTLPEPSGFTGLSQKFKDRVSSDLLSFTLVFASKDVAEKLQIHPRDPAYEILRLRKVDRNPYVLERLYLSPALIPGINENILSKSLYSYIENTLHLSISSASQVIRADRATPLDQQQLKISSSDPVLEISQIAYLQNGKPFEYSINRYHHRHATTSLILTRSESQL